MKTPEQIENHSEAIARMRNVAPSYVTDEAPMFVSADSLRVVQDGDAVRLELNGDERRLVLLVWADEWPEFLGKLNGKHD